MRSIKEQIENDGFLKIDEDVFIYTTDEIIEQQKTWDESDKAKHFDFTTHDYWLIEHSNNFSDGIPKGFLFLGDALMHSGI